MKIKINNSTIKSEIMFKNIDRLTHNNKQYKRIQRNKKQIEIKEEPKKEMK